MTISIALLFLVPLFPVNAAPPAVQISNGEIQPVGTATACSTITTTIGTRVDHIPVPCSAFPPVFTEEVIVNGTSASLVIGPSGDIDFENEPWLAQPTSLATPYSQTPSHPSNKTAGSFISSQIGPPNPRSQTTSFSYTSASGGSLSSQSESLGSGSHTASTTSNGALSVSPYSQSQSQSSGSPTHVSNSSGAFESSFSRNVTLSHSFAASSGITTSTRISASLSSNGASGGLSSSVPSRNISASNTDIPIIASPPITTSIPRLSSAVSQSLGGQNPSIRSQSLPIGSKSSQSSGSQVVNSTRTSAESSLSTQSRSLESLSSGQSRALLTASPASLTISIPSTTTTSRAVSSGPGGISPGFPSSAFVPIATPITSLDPIGPVVKSSASAVQSSISTIIPVIQSYIDTPTCDSCSTDAVNALKGVLPIIEDLSDSIGPGPSPHPCSASLNLLSDIFNAVKCAAQNVENAISHIEGGEDDISDLKSDVTNLNDLQKPLDNDDEDDDDESQSAPSQSQSNPTQSQSLVSKASASQVSASTSSMASKVSLSASSSSSTVVSSSSGSCALPPVVTLPPDSSTGPSQPDQPTSVIVTGLPTSVIRSSNTLITVTVSISGTGAGSVVPATTTQTTPITPAPTISCSLQNEDPDQGINTDYCVCSGSTFPVLSVDATATGPGASCAYTSLPTASTVHPTANLPVITSNCQVCSVGFDSEQCTPLPNCTPTSAPASAAAITTTSAPPPLSSPPICSAGFYGTDTSCGGKCNGAKANCECTEAGYETFNEACTCTCG